jgi:type IV secretion system protein VirD4
MTRPAPPDATSGVLLTVAATVLAPAGLLHAAGVLTATISGLPAPDRSLVQALEVLADPANPGAALGIPDLPVGTYWTAVTLLLALAAGLAAVAYTAMGRLRRPTRDPRRLLGVADAGDIARTASARVLRRRGAQLRPSLAKPRPADVGYLLGTSRGRQVWASVEDSILLLGPPRSGKGLHVVINAILDAPCAVITTATRPDNIAATLTARQAGGPVAVFDPQHLAAGLPAGLRWSPIRGCADPHTAMIRAAGLAAGTAMGAGGVEGGGFWEAKTRTAVQALLHAAALDDLPPATLYRWALNPVAAADAVRILHTANQAADGWADSLDGLLSADPRTRDSIWQGVAQAFSALADPRVLDAITPTAGEQFDPATFLRERGTLYLLSTGAGAGASAPLVAALVEDLVETARLLAAASANARLDPPLLLALDEIGNLAPLPSLPTLMADGGGSGITTMPVLQSLAQGRARWGEHAAAAIWDASIVKVLLGGASGSRDLADISTLLGDRDDSTTATGYDRHGGRSHQQSIRRVPVLPPETLRTLPFGIAVVLLRATRPIVTTLRPWTARGDADAITRHRDDAEALIRHAAQNAGAGVGGAPT